MFQNAFTRRGALQTLTTGLGGIAMTALTEERALAAKTGPLAAKQPHFAPRAKNVIYLSMRGAPSHVDTFDYKPQLTKDSGKPGKYGGRDLMGSPFEFNQHGESGLWISELFPNVAQHADDLCLINSMHGDSSNHQPAVTAMHTGSVNFIRPSMGAWALYGLGTENTNVPGYVVLGGGQKGDYSSAFLPAYYQATMIGGDNPTAGPPRVPNIRNTKMDADAQRKQLDFVQWLNRNQLERDVHSPETEGMIQSTELAYHMQTSMPELLDYESETPDTLESYGIGGESESFGKHCLLARRMVERGVRFVEIVHGNWDHHDKLKENLTQTCGETDGPIAALLQDLKDRDMLKDTLILWGGEFGRTATGEGDGRGHNSRGFTTWMAGGGAKGGMRYGATDEHGNEAVENKMHIHDWHATIMHLLGLNHKKLTYRYAGRDFRLTDVHGNVAQDIVA
ncbi:MAG: DUF1501 domain-containing protein [Verrucomicrobiales bacterium]|nr:DUF1501 domain-containing protein [Verrucomicrobiales bacterium]